VLRVQPPITSLIFSKSQNKRKKIVLGLPNPDPKSSTQKQRNYGKKLNPSDRIYLVCLLFEDFLDVSPMNLPMQGFTFQKALVIRSRLPLFAFYFDLLGIVAGAHRVTSQTPSK
jgi:hypothetical protein